MAIYNDRNAAKTTLEAYNPGKDITDGIIDIYLEYQWHDYCFDMLDWRSKKARYDHQRSYIAAMEKLKGMGIMVEPIIPCKMTITN